MSRSRRPRTRNRSRRPAPERPTAAHSSGARVLSSEEKHELILAHAAARRPLKPRDRMTLWGGIVVSILFVAAAWAVTVESGIGRLRAQTQDTGISAIAEASGQLKEEFQASTSGTNRDLADSFREAQAAIQHELEMERARAELIDALSAPTSTEDEATEATSTSDITPSSTEETVNTSTTSHTPTSTSTERN